VEIKSPGSIIKLPLSANREIQIKGAYGEVMVGISGGSARIKRASCPDGLCLRMGSISRPGQAIVCVPNHISVRIPGTCEEGIDGVTR